MKRTSITFLFLLLWLLAAASFLIGVVTPVMSIQQFYLFEDSFSILSALALLFADGQKALALLIGVFSLGVPLLKFWVLGKAIADYRQQGQVNSRTIQWIHRYGRWSMLDVFVIAVLIVGVKLSAFASVTLHFGLWAFTAGLLLLLLLTSALNRLR